MDQRGPLPTASVVVAARDAAATLPACLASLRALDYPAVEVIVVDDGSRDGTAAVAARHGAAVVNSGGLGAAAARNAGAASATGAILAFTDADCTVDPGWLTTLSGALSQPGVAAAGGPQHNAFPPAPGPVNAAIEAFFGMASIVADYTRRDRRAREVPHNASCNSAYWHGAFDQVGGFTPGLWPGEDVDLDYRLRRAGHRCYYVPGAVVTHHRPGGMPWFARMMRRYGHAQGVLVRIHGPFRAVDAVPPLLACLAAAQLLLWPAASRLPVAVIDLTLAAAGAVWIGATVPRHLWLPVAGVAARAAVEWHLGYVQGLRDGPPRRDGRRQP